MCLQFAVLFLFFRFTFLLSKDWWCLKQSDGENMWFDKGGGVTSLTNGLEEYLDLKEEWSNAIT
jgi:hypothetical protein